MKKRIAKILVAALALALIVASFAMIISADGGTDNTSDYVVGGEVIGSYNSLAEAVGAASSNPGGTVVLKGNQTIDAKISFRANVTIDLNGYTITSTGANYTMFEMGAEGLTVMITGEGRIVHAAKGSVFSANTFGTFKMIGTGYGIHIDHKFQSKWTPELFSFVGKTVQVDSGDGTMVDEIRGMNVEIKNVSVMTDAVAAENVVSRGGVVNVRMGTTAKFENFTLRGTAQTDPSLTSVAYNSNYLFRLDETSFLHMKSSHLRAASNGIYFYPGSVGKEAVTPNASDAAEATDVYSVIVEDTTFILDRFYELDGETIPTYRVTPFTFLRFGDATDNAAPPDTTGKIYIKDSHVAMSSTFVSYGPSVDSAKDLVMVDNSNVKLLKHKFDNNGTISDTRNDTWLISGSVYVNFINNSRVDSAWQKNITRNASGVDSKVDEGIENEGTYTVDFEAGTRATANNIAQFDMPEGKKWIFDPVADPDYPYVLADDEYVTAVDFGAYENYDTQTVGGSPTTAFPATTTGGGMLLDTVTEVFGKNTRTFEVPYKTNGTLDTKFSGVTNAGSITFSEDGETLTSWGTNFPVYRGYFEAAKTGSLTDAKVAVIDLDIASDNGVFPYFQLQARFTYTSGYHAPYIEIKPDGSIVGVSGKSLSTTGWNNMKIIFNLDSGTRNVQYYLNGELIKTTSVAAAVTGFSYFEIRFPQPTDAIVQNAGAKLSVRNGQIYTYKELKGGDYNALDYVLSASSGSGKYNGESGAITVNGKPYATLDAALAAAENLGTFVMINDDVDGIQVVTSEGTVLTNGYDISYSSATIPALVEETAFGAGKNVVRFTSDVFGTGEPPALEDISVNASWYAGTEANPMADSENIKTSTGLLGNAPVPPTVEIDDVVIENVVLEFKGKWTNDNYIYYGDFDSYEEYEAAVANLNTTILPVTLSELAAGGERPMYFPIFEKKSEYDYMIKNDGNVVGMGTGISELGAAMAGLNSGDVVVFYNDFTIPSALSFEGTEQAPVTISFDLNGRMLKVESSITLINAGSYSTVNVYSSKAGAVIQSYVPHATVDRISGSAVFVINSNAEQATINVGACGVDSRKDNITLNIAGLVTTYGNYSTSFNLDGGIVNGVGANSYGLMMARGYGAINISRATIIQTIPYDTYTLAKNLYDVRTSDGYDETAQAGGATFTDCNIISNRDNEVFYYSNVANVTITINNCRVAAAIGGVAAGNVVVGEGTECSSIDLAHDTVSLANQNLEMFIYKTPMNMFSHYNGTAFVNNAEYVIEAPTKVVGEVALGESYNYKVSTEAIGTEATGTDVVRVLPTFKYKVADNTTANSVTVKWLNLAGAEALVEKYFSAANVDLTGATFDGTVEDVAINAAIARRFMGTFTKDNDASTASVIVMVPDETVTSTVDGVAINAVMTLHSSLAMNLFIPAEYFDAMDAATKALLVKDGNGAPMQIPYGTETYYIISKDVDTNLAATTQSFTLKFVSADGEYEITHTYSTTLTDYAKTVLEDSLEEEAEQLYTAKDHKLMFYLLTYLDKAYEYYAATYVYRDNLNYDLDAYLEDFESVIAATDFEVPTAAAGNFASLSGVIGISVNLKSNPQYVISIKDRAFAGKIKVNGEELTVTNGIATVDFLAACEFDGTITIEIDANSDGTAEKTGTYSYTDYMEAFDGESAELDALLEAFYNYVLYSKAYVTAP